MRQLTVHHLSNGGEAVSDDAIVQVWRNRVVWRDEPACHCRTRTRERGDLSRLVLVVLAPCSEQQLEVKLSIQLSLELRQSHREQKCSVWNLVLDEIIHDWKQATNIELELDDIVSDIYFELPNCCCWGRLRTS